MTNDSIQDAELTRLLELAADRVATRVAPIGEIVSVAASRRRRRRTTIVVTAVLLAAVAGGAVLLGTAAGPVLHPTRTGPVATLHDTSTTRVVGIGRAAIRVPRTWATNRTRCGTPQVDTVVVDQPINSACGSGRPDDVDSVELVRGEPRPAFRVDSTAKLDGIGLQRQRTSCASDPFGGGKPICTGAVYLPSLDVGFVAESTTDAATVDRLLRQVRVVRHQVAVPGHVGIADDQRTEQRRYVATVTALGLVARVHTTSRPGYPPGYVLRVSPAPGTLLRPGDHVTVETVAPQPDPADRADIYVRTPHGGRDYGELRRGVTIRLHPGQRFWIYAVKGSYGSTLAGRLQGTSVRVDPFRGPNYPHAWLARKPGRSMVSVSIEAGGQKIVVGTITAIVS